MGKRRRSAINADVQDLVAVFPMQKANELEKVRIMEHITVTGDKAYTVQNKKLPQSVVLLGEDVQKSDADDEWLLAVKSLETGEVDFRPVRVMNFVPKITSDAGVLIGTARKAERHDFTVDHSIKPEDRAAHRSSLIEQFGSLQKQRVLASSQRRQIRTETLENMQRSAFASTPITQVDDLIDVKDTKSVTLLGNAEQISAILPEPVKGAERPADVYPIGTFVEEAYIEAHKDEAKAYLLKVSKDYNAELAYFDPIRRQLVGMIPNDAARQVGLLKLAALMALIRYSDKNELRTNHLETTQISSLVLHEAAADFLGGFSARKNSVNKVQREKMLAHALALALTLMESNSIYVDAWTRALNIGDKRVTAIAQALGCSVSQVTNVAEATRFNGTRVAKLLGPPGSSGSKMGFRRRSMRARNK